MQGLLPNPRFSPRKHGFPGSSPPLRSLDHEKVSRELCVCMRSSAALIHMHKARPDGAACARAWVLMASGCSNPLGEARSGLSTRHDHTASLQYSFRRAVSSGWEGEKHRSARASVGRKLVPTTGASCPGCNAHLPQPYTRSHQAQARAGTTHGPCPHGPAHLPSPTPAWKTGRQPPGGAKEWDRRESVLGAP